MRCDSCPVAAGKPCLGETEQFALFCEWAATGDPAKAGHIVGRSAVGGGPPSLARQAVNLAGAVVVAVASGGKKVPPEEQARRLAICGGCEHFDPAGVKCRRCGCHLNLKARLEAWHCPIQKW